MDILTFSILFLLVFLSVFLFYGRERVLYNFFNKFKQKSLDIEGQLTDSIDKGVEDFEERSAILDKHKNTMDKLRLACTALSVKANVSIKSIVDMDWGGDEYHHHKGRLIIWPRSYITLRAEADDPVDIKITKTARDKKCNLTLHKNNKDLWVVTEFGESYTETNFSNEISAFRFITRKCIEMCNYWDAASFLDLYRQNYYTTNTPSISGLITIDKNYELKI